MSLKDLLKTLVTVLVSLVPTNFLGNLINGLLTDLEVLIANNSIEKELIEPLIGLIRSSLGLPSTVVQGTQNVIPNVNQGTPINSNPVISTQFNSSGVVIPALYKAPVPVTGQFYPGDIDNRVNFVNLRLQKFNLQLSNVDVPTIDKIILQPTAWQSGIDNYLEIKK